MLVSLFLFRDKKTDETILTLIYLWSSNTSKGATYHRRKAYYLVLQRTERELSDKNGRQISVQHQEEFCNN